MNNSFGNVLLVVILVLIVGFGVWYVTARHAPAAPAPAVQLNVGGDAGGGQAAPQ